MNTPTPAQALGDALKMIGQPSDVRSDYEWQNCARECMQFLVQHGQHFAGLERDLEIVRGLRLAAAKELGLSNRRAIAAEARVREAEGLLRECVLVIHKAAALAGMDPTTEPTPESLGGRVAAFLAAKGGA